MVACKGDPSPDDGSSDTAGETPTSGGETGDTQSAEPTGCEPPEDLPADPIVMTGSVQYTVGDAFFMELVDLQLVDTTVYAVGPGGLMAFDVSDPAKPFLANHFMTEEHYKFHRVEPLDDGLVVATQRDEELVIVDMTTEPPALLFEQRINGVEGIARAGDYILLTIRDHGVQAVDVSTPTTPRPEPTVPGLSAPWELSAVVDGWTYAADAALGLVPIDATDPQALVVHEPIPMQGILHVAADEHALYASTGSGGVVILDRSDPAVPTTLATVSVAGSAVMAAVDGDILYVADHEGITTLDVTDRSAPVPIGIEVSEEFALAVDAGDGIAWVGDWTILAGYAVDPTIQAPDLDLASDSLGLPVEGGTTTATLHNRGGAPLSITGVSTTDLDKVTATVDAEVIEPGGTATLQVTSTGGDTLDGIVCLASNDPDRPVLELPTTAGVEEPPIGELAPDFELTELGTGDLHRLSDHLGQPVLLVLFAYW